jgi:hypothetical protein
MDISKSTIINNFEWLLAQQTAVDMLKLDGLHDLLVEATDQLKALELPTIDTHPEELLEKPVHSNHHYYPIYALFQRLNSIQTNKLTYLPNIVGIYLLMNVAR